MAIVVGPDGYLIEDPNVPVSPDLDTLLEGLPGYAAITDGMKVTALAGALIPDSSGVWPGQTGYVATYDVYFAAITLVGFLKAQPVVRTTSSEGTSISVDAPDWGSLLAYYRSMSPIIQASGSDVIQRVDIPEGPHVVRTDMTGRGSSDGNIDTDVG